MFDPGYTAGRESQFEREVQGARGTAQIHHGTVPVYGKEVPVCGREVQHRGERVEGQGLADLLHTTT